MRVLFLQWHRKGAYTQSSVLWGGVRASGACAGAVLGVCRRGIRQEGACAVGAGGGVL